VTTVAEQDRSDIEAMLSDARRRLLEQRVPAGYWVGELSSSALSTATASFALHLFAHSPHAGTKAERCSRLAARGLRWLAASQNGDGGWGDTTRSRSNISTTALCWATLRAVPGGDGRTVSKAEAWLRAAAGSLDPAELSAALSARYGKDRTFSVPILTMCAAAGVLGPGDAGWRHVPQLPFELAAMPRSWFSFLRLPVVSYALPALIAIGQARHERRPSRNPLGRCVRALTVARTLRVLEQIQPTGGGFLEATPLTSFVVMSLVAAGRGGAAVVSRGADFLIASVREDGSWPIDSNLATWVTTLSVNALAAAGKLGECLPAPDRAAIVKWLLGQQYRVRHPYTGAAPGGWAWTDLPGGVPDADDTAGALLALRNLASCREEAASAACAGVTWLLGLQNRDGGIPTFCRGWGALPFDRSTPELTAHALHAWSAWRDCCPAPLEAEVDRASRRAVEFLRQNQSPAGSWTPLWFGNEAAANEENPTYGTARVVSGLAAARHSLSERERATSLPLIEDGAQWLLRAQGRDGGWGGTAGVAASVEETCHAAQALAAVISSRPGTSEDGLAAECRESIIRARHWLQITTQDGQRIDPCPIGLYFAKLWYWERLYPLIAMAALP
jgi:squalene-hopene/tetraprenyl-beta-curcumene cyclase